MLISKQGWKKLKNGKIVYKDINDLNNSNHRVIVKCDECDKEFETIWSNRKKRLKNLKKDLCNSCAKSGNRNSQYGKDRKELCAIARKHQNKNPMQGKVHSASTKSKMSNIKVSQISNGEFDLLSNNRSQKIWYFSIKNNASFCADSVLELFRMTQLDSDNKVKCWTKRHKIKVPYMLDGIKKYTTPDFLIELIDNTKVIEEIKGWVSKKELIKKEALKKYCTENGFSFSYKTQKDLNINGSYRKFLKKINDEKN